MGEPGAARNSSVPTDLRDGSGVVLVYEFICLPIAPLVEVTAAAAVAVELESAGRVWVGTNCVGRRPRAGVVLRLHIHQGKRGRENNKQRVNASNKDTTKYLILFIPPAKQ